METSRFLARLVGPFLVAIGAGLLINGDVYQQMAAQFLQNLGLIYLSGLLTLLAGLAIVNTHNVWTADWRVIITIFGWLGIIGGALRIMFPQLVETVGTAMLAQRGLIVGVGRGARARPLAQLCRLSREGRTIMQAKLFFSPSWPGLSRPSTPSKLRQRKTWMPAGMTI